MESRCRMWSLFTFNGVWLLQVVVSRCVVATEKLLSILWLRVCDHLHLYVCECLRRKCLCLCWEPKRAGNTLLAQQHLRSRTSLAYICVKSKRLIKNMLPASRLVYVNADSRMQTCSETHTHTHACAPSHPICPHMFFFKSPLHSLYVHICTQTRAPE